MLTLKQLEERSADKRKYWFRYYVIPFIWKFIIGIVYRHKFYQLIVGQESYQDPNDCLFIYSRQVNRKKEVHLKYYPKWGRVWFE